MLVVVGQVVQLLLAVLRREEGSEDETQSPTSNLLSTPPTSVETSSFPTYLYLGSTRLPLPISLCLATL